MMQLEAADTAVAADGNALARVGKRARHLPGAIGVDGCANCERLIWRRTHPMCEPTMDDETLTLARMDAPRRLSLLNARSHSVYWASFLPNGPAGKWKPPDVHPGAISAEG